ncbi:MAG: formate--phosphoribosylaminoimidazolecarboxamide ligase [Promethearchaeota archaeon]
MKIGTIASHSALNILSGAKSEGFETVLYCTPTRRSFYDSFGLKDSIVEVESFDEVLEQDLSDVILIPHGSFVAYLGAQQILDSKIRLFGNKQLLRWEEDPVLKAKLMNEAGFQVPREFESPEDIDCTVIAKTQGAAGGNGYFIARNSREAKEKIDPSKEYHFQEYIVGTKVFVTYFNSLSLNRTEVFGADIRYETDADANLRFDNSPSFVVIGNLPLVLRESILVKYYEMGIGFVEAFQKVAGETVSGPFCIETIIDKDQNIVSFEFSGRIVAGTNVWIPTSPYSYLQFGKPIWMGKRIAIEIRELIKQGRLEEALT